MITNTETKLDKTEVTMKWNRPAYHGGDPNITYNVEWKDSSDPSAEPEKKEGIKETTYKISDLENNKEYEVSVYAVNRQGQGLPAKKYFKVDASRFYCAFAIVCVYCLLITDTFSVCV